MKLYIKQKVLSFRNQFTVKDGNGRTRYTVKGELISLGKRLHIYDAQGQEIALLKQKIISFMPRFIVNVRGEDCAQIVKKFTLFRPQYHVDGLDWTIDGRIMEHDYTIRKGHHTIAQIHKVWMSWGDSYEMEIDDSADELTAVAVVLAIDAVLASEDEAASASASN